MNPEKPKFDHSKETAEDTPEQDLTTTQKMGLGQAWTKMIIDDDRLPDNITVMNNNEIKKWLFGSLMKDVEKFSEELGLQVDSKLIERIKKADNPSTKAVLQLKYIKKVHAQVAGIVRGFDQAPGKCTRWDSWPKKMRKAKKFNCVGATLIGVHLLESAGIESQFGNPPGHAVNIARLANGDWWYVDFMNGQHSLVKLKPKKVSIAGVLGLKINQPAIDYQLLPLFGNEVVVGAVLGNLSDLKDEAKDRTRDEKTPAKEKVKKEAQEYLARYSKYFEKTDFSLLLQKLFPKFLEVEETDTIKKETTRINAMRDLKAPIKRYTKALSKDEQRALAIEIKNKKEAIENLFYKEDQSVLQKTSPQLKKLLQLLSQELEVLKKKHPKTYREALDKMVGGISYS